MEENCLVDHVGVNIIEEGSAFPLSMMSLMSHAQAAKCVAWPARKDFQEMPSGLKLSEREFALMTCMILDGFAGKMTSPYDVCAKVILKRQARQKEAL